MKVYFEEESEIIWEIIKDEEDEDYVNYERIRKLLSKREKLMKNFFIKKKGYRLEETSLTFLFRTI
jgi:hypothetical protein